MGRHAIGALLALALVGCGGTQTGISSTEDAYETMLVGTCEPGEPLELLAHEQRGRRLYLEVRHSGGCESHSYVACMEDPHPHEPQVYSLRIHRDGHGDVCRGEVYKVLRIDLDRDITVTSIEGGVISLE